MKQKRNEYLFRTYECIDPDNENEQSEMKIIKK